MKQLADSDIVHVQGGGNFESEVVTYYGPSAAQIAQLLAWISANPRTPHAAD